jgi:hypothetical protein
MFLFNRKTASFRMRHNHLLKIAAGDFEIGGISTFYNRSLTQDVCEVGG